MSKMQVGPLGTAAPALAPSKGVQAVLAHNMINKAIRAGRLVREACAECGQLDADAHHEDYTQPLEVIWLCRIHHVEHHMGLPLSQLDRRYEDDPERVYQMYLRIHPRADGKGK